MVELYANNEVGKANSPQVTVIRPSGNLNLQCDNIVNPPNGEFVFTTYRTIPDPDTGEQVVDPSSICEMTGTSSTNIITITSFAPGNTDSGNQVGDHVVFRPGAHWANIVAKRLDPAGTFNVNQDRLATTVQNLTASRNWVLPGTGVITQNTGLIGSLSNIKYYINGRPYEKTSIADKTYVATRDTYVFIDTAGTVTYTDVAVGAAAPATPANSVLVGVVTTNASAITVISVRNHGAIASDSIDFTTLAPSYFSGTGASIAVTAPYNCIFEVEYTCARWGFGGGTLTVGVGNVTGLTTLAQYSQTISGGDTIARSVTAKRVFSGGVSGTAYTFTESITGSVGGGDGRAWMVKCVRV